jgi:hypothetical protein
VLFRELLGCNFRPEIRRDDLELRRVLKSTAELLAAASAAVTAMVAIVLCGLLRVYAR